MKDQVEKGCIDLDQNHSAKPSEATVAEMIPYYRERWALLSSPHASGQGAIEAVSSAYGDLYAFFGASEADHLVITSSGTEAVNQAIYSVYQIKTREEGRNHFLTTNIDQAASIMAIGRLEDQGCLSGMIECDKNGEITAHSVAEAISPRTAMVSMAWANPLTGVIHPVEEIGKLCKERGILFHLDASHVVGKIYFDLNEVGADFLSVHGTQMHGPAGTGLLLARAPNRAEAWIQGGANQGGSRGGELNLPGLMGLASAARELKEAQDCLCMELGRLRDRFEQAILNGVNGARVFFIDRFRLPNTTAIAFPGVASELLLYHLSQEGVYASLGGGETQRIHLILEAAGVQKEEAQTALSFSLSRETTEQEIELAAEVVVRVANRLRSYSEQLFVGGSNA